MGYLLTKNRRRLIAGVRTTPATGRAGCEMAKMTMMPAAQDAGQCSARIRLDRGRRRAAQDPASRPSPGWTDGHVDGGGMQPGASAQAGGERSMTAQPASDVPGRWRIAETDGWDTHDINRLGPFTSSATATAAR